MERSSSRTVAAVQSNSSSSTLTAQHSVAAPLQSLQGFGLWTKGCCTELTTVVVPNDYTAPQDSSVTDSWSRTHTLVT